MHYPKLSDLLSLSETDLTNVAEALRSLIRVTYGERHWALTAQDRVYRATLKKLVNLVDQLILLDDIDVYELGFNCPQQLRRYHTTLQATMPVGYQRGLEREHLRTLDEAHQRLWQVMNEVTFIYDGLS